MINNSRRSGEIDIRILQSRCRRRGIFIFEGILNVFNIHIIYY